MSNEFHGAPHYEYQEEVPWWQMIDVYNQIHERLNIFQFKW